MANGSLDSRLKKFLIEAMEEEIKRIDYSELKSTAKQIVKQKIREDVYNTYTPKEYDRTGSLEDSVDATIRKTKNGVNLSVGHDPAKLHHTSVVSGNGTQGVPDFINEGAVYPLWGLEGDTSYLEQKDYFNDSEPEIIAEVYDIIEKQL